MLGADRAREFFWCFSSSVDAAARPELAGTAVRGDGAGDDSCDGDDELVIVMRGVMVGCLCCNKHLLHS